MARSETQDGARLPLCRRRNKEPARFRFSRFSEGLHVSPMVALGGKREREPIFIMPHWAGLLFAVAVFGIFVWGYFVQGFGGMAQTLVICLVVAGVVALFQTNENLRGIALLSLRSDPVMAGEDAVLEAVFANFSSHERIGLRVRVRSGWKLEGDGRLPFLGSGETARVLVRIPTSRRGCFPHPALWVSSTFPMGLCFAWRIFAGGGKYHVYPPPAGKRLLPVLGGADCPGRGGLTGDGDVGWLRSYMPGDALSRIHWKAFAKSGRLLAKTADGGGLELVVLRWEDTAGNIESRLSQMSLWVSECETAGVPFRMQLVRGRTESDLRACRIAMAEFQDLLP